MRKHDLARLIGIAIATSCGLVSSSATLAEAVQWREHVVATSSEASVITTIDFDNDGDLDVVTATVTPGSVSWWENVSGDGSSWEERIVYDTLELSRPEFVVPTDIDGDMDLDLVVADYNDANPILHWAENLDGLGTQWEIHLIVSYGPPATAYVGEAGDVDGDGDTDLIVALGLENLVLWVENKDGLGTEWAEHVIGPLDNPEKVMAVDLDADGDLDIAGSNYVFAAPGFVLWWENDGGDGLNWVEHIVSNEIEFPISFSIVDLDGDADLDFVIPAFSGDRIAWSENVDGMGTLWVDHSIETSFENPRSAYPGDVDGDGDPDILASGEYEPRGAVGWWENVNGDASSWTEHVVDSEFLGATTVTGADLNGDGRLDAVAAAAADETIYWWENLGRTAGPLLDVTGSCPGEITVSITGADPNASVILLSAAEPGADARIPPGRPCAGLSHGLDMPRVLTTIETDAGGNAALSREIGDSCDSFLRALDTLACEMTNMLQTPHAP